MQAAIFTRRKCPAGRFPASGFTARKPVAPVTGNGRA
jgi:hypothetical protein